MQKLILCFFLCTAIHTCITAQKISGNIHIEPGKTYIISMEIKNSITQQAGNQAIGFSATGSVTHSFKAISAHKPGNTLHHQIQRLDFHFDGMGQTKSFDSDNKKDRESPSGKQLEQVLTQEYDLWIDSSGTTMLSDPAKINVAGYEDRMVILNDLVKDLSAVAYPPKKDDASFFKVLPGYAVGIGDSWGDSVNTTDMKSATINTLSAITDSTIVVSFKTAAVTKTKSEMMGMQATTRMNYSGAGTIVLDKTTGIIREKTIVTDSNGNTEAMNATLPVTGKSTITIRVRQQ